ncbi:MAG: DUF4097 family beta strand repeat-containing protein [Acidobacteriota bacterium]
MRGARGLHQIAAVLVLGWAVAGCDIAVDGHGGLDLHFASGRAQDEWTRSYQLAPGGRFELVNVNGKIEAEAAEGGALEIKAERVARGRSDEAAKELLGQIEMREEAGADRVRVEVRTPRVSFGGHEVRWTLRVPRGVHVDLRTVNGGVLLTGLDGEVRARATNGGIRGRSLVAASVDASVTNGGVDVEVASLAESGSISLESVNGGVGLALPSDAKADVNAQCVNGGISVSGLELAVVGEQSRRRIEGRLNGGGGRVTLKTVNGGVRLSALPPSAAR